MVSMMLELLKARFSEHKGLHPDLEWLEVEQRLRVFPDAIAVLQKMEESGGEPDTIGYDEKTGKLIFCDCAKESPSGRRSLCYDEKALQGRAKNPPSSSAERKAKEIGVSLMTEELYRAGSLRRMISAVRAARCSANGAMIPCSLFTTARIPIILCADSEDIFLSEYRLNNKSIVRILPETERLMHNFRFVEMSEYVPFRRTLLVSVPFGRT